MLILQTSKKFCPHTRIVRCEDYAIFEQAENILESAKNKRKKLLEQADLQIALLKENAKKDLENLKRDVENAQEKQCQERKIELLFSMLGKGVEFFSHIEGIFVQTLKSLFVKILGECPPEERMYKLVKNTIKKPIKIKASIVELVRSDNLGQRTRLASLLIPLILNHFNMHHSSYFVSL